MFPLVSERIFEDHESLVELMSMWGRHSNNSIYFLSNPQKYVMFRNIQVSVFLVVAAAGGWRSEPALLLLKVFYLWRKDRVCVCGLNQQTNQLLIQVGDPPPLLPSSFTLLSMFHSHTLVGPRRISGVRQSSFRTWRECST